MKAVVALMHLGLGESCNILDQNYAFCFTLRPCYRYIVGIKISQVLALLYKANLS